MEIWKDIKGYEGLYQISNLGNVKSLKRKVYAGRGRTRWQLERILSNNKTNGRGYKLTCLGKEGKEKNFYIHRLVAEAFISDKTTFKSMPEENRNEIDLDKLEVNHKDENKANNNVNNLEWCTAKYNSAYNGLHIRNGLKNRNNKYSERILQLDDNNNIIKEYPSIKEASRCLNVSYQAISDCLRGIQKHSAGYRWKYVIDK